MGSEETKQRQLEAEKTGEKANPYGTVGHLYRSVGVFIKWVLLGTATGSIVGVMGVLFHFSVEWATKMREGYPWLLFLLPLGGIAIALLYKVTGMEKDMGTNTILEAVRGEHSLRLRTAPLIFASTVLTHLFGGSSGREGAAASALFQHLYGEGLRFRRTVSHSKYVFTRLIRRETAPVDGILGRGKRLFGAVRIDLSLIHI